MSTSLSFADISEKLISFKFSINRRIGDSINFYKNNNYSIRVKRSSKEEQGVNEFTYTPVDSL